MDFSNMTKQQLKEYGETIGVKLDLRKKKDVLIEELRDAISQESSAATNSNSTSFDVKQYIWLIIFGVVLLAIASGTNLQYAAGVLSSMIIKDGLILTLIVWAVMTKAMKRESWEWYDWLNALAYTTMAGRILYVLLVG
jgi:S-adenosylhomocysteine hydrolase